MNTTATLSALETLRPGRQWVCFNEAKVPFNPITGKEAKANDPSTWGTYKEASEAQKANPQRYKGIGYETIKEQGITFGDLDHCIDDEGNLSSYAQYVIGLINSYTEYSPSGKGLRFIVYGTIPSNIGANAKLDGDNRLEMKDHGGYFTITENHLPGTPITIEDRQEQLTALYDEKQTQRMRTQGVQKTQPTSFTKVTQANGDTPYGLKALALETAIMASTPEGSREVTLNQSCLKMGSLIAGNELTLGTVEHELRAAALQSGLTDKEIDAKFRHSISDGMKTPRSAPQHNDWQQIETSILQIITSSNQPHNEHSQKEKIALAIAERNENDLYACTQEIALLDKKKIAQLKRAIRLAFGPAFPMRDFENILKDEQRKLEEAIPYIPEIKSARSLMKVQFKPVDWIVDKILPPGLIVLAGKQKIGKSWLDLMFSYAVASGGKAFQSIDVKQGDVLYLALEDNERRIQDRLQQLSRGQEIPDAFEYVTSWPRMDAKGIAALERWIQSKPNPRLIIIDPWVKVKPRIKQRAGETGYDADYEALQDIKRLADTYNVCILIQFHLRKESADDYFDEVNATSGATSCADGLLSIKRGRGEADATLLGTGRDYKEDVDLALSFDKGFWKILGNAAEYSLSKASKEVLDVLKAEGKPLYAKQIAAILDQFEGTIRKRLYDMKQRGEVKDTGQGYLPVEGNSSNEGNESNPGNGGNAHPYSGQNTDKMSKSVTQNEQRYLHTNGHVTHSEQPVDYAYEGNVTSVTSVTSTLTKEERKEREAMILQEYQVNEAARKLSANLPKKPAGGVCGMCGTKAENFVLAEVLMTGKLKWICGRCPLPSHHELVIPNNGSSYSLAKGLDVLCAICKRNEATSYWAGGDPYCDDCKRKEQEVQS